MVEVCPRRRGKSDAISIAAAQSERVPRMQPRSFALPCCRRRRRIIDAVEYRLRQRRFRATTDADVSGTSRVSLLHLGVKKRTRGPLRVLPDCSKAFGPRASTANNLNQPRQHRHAINPAHDRVRSCSGAGYGARCRRSRSARSYWALNRPATIDDPEHPHAQISPSALTANQDKNHLGILQPRLPVIFLTETVMS